MQIGPFDLTYCTNIHPADGWDGVLANLQRYAPALKKRLAPNARFGLGLRLSSEESKQLLLDGGLDQLLAFLQEHGLYVSVINGFPFGSFHGQAVKEKVFAPDWRDEERVSYTLRLVGILDRLLEPGDDGGISTCPLSYKQWMKENDSEGWQIITTNIVRVAEAMVRASQKGDRSIHLDIEPEPDGLIENSKETTDFYRKWLLGVGAPLLAESLKISIGEARQKLLDHVQICFDTCHFAVEYEHPHSVLERFSQLGIKVGRIQISSAMRIPIPGDRAQKRQIGRLLEPFAESTYLHQVVELQKDGELRHYPDLSDAIKTIEDIEATEWRTHFHIPLFTGEYESFSSTQGYIREVLALFLKNRFTRHLEIETYTWDVLPPALKADLLDSILREYRWVLDELALSDKARPA